MDTASLVLSFDPEVDEHARAMARHSVAANKTARIFMFLGAVSVALGVYSLVVDTRVNDAVGGFGVVFGLLLLLSNSPPGRRRQLRAVIRQTPTLSGHREVVAAADGLRVGTPISDSRLSWSQYERVVDDELGVTLVRRGGTTVDFVPRRAFSDAGEQSAWSQSVRAWVEASAPTNA